MALTSCNRQDNEGTQNNANTKVLTLPGLQYERYKSPATSNRDLAECDTTSKICLENLTINKEYGLYRFSDARVTLKPPKGRLVYFGDGYIKLFRRGEQTLQFYVPAEAWWRDTRYMYPIEANCINGNYVLAIRRPDYLAFSPTNACWAMVSLHTTRREYVGSLCLIRPKEALA